MRKALLRSIVLVLISSFFGMEAYGQLSGAYTINAGSAASATNYQNFTSAVSDMISGTRSDGGTPNGPAVSGPVTFTVATGTYNESLSITQITGASATNTITFDGVNPANRKITSASTSSGQATIQVNGADYLRFENLEIENTGTIGYGMTFLSLADNNEVTNCKLSVNPTATSGYSAGISVTTYYTVYGNFATNLTVQDCEFDGGYNGLVINGQASSYTNGHHIEGNTFRNYYYAAMYINYSQSIELYHNDCKSRTTYNLAHGIYIRYSNEFDIAYNKIHETGAYGIYCYYPNSSSFSPATIRNNMIGGGFYTTSYAYGMYLYGARYLNVYHNSVNCEALNGSGARAFYLSGSTSTQTDFRNNVFRAFAPAGGTGVQSYYVASSTYMTTMDYNMYQSNGTYLGYMSGYQANLTALQAAYTAWNQNSQEGNPNFLGVTNLHTFGPALNNWAVNIPAIVDDIDGDTRPLAPDTVKDVGADEIVLAPFDMDITQVVSPLVVSTGSNTVSVEVMNGGSNSLNGISTTLQYSTNGGTTWAVSQSFTPTSLGASGNTEIFTFTVPWVVATAGTYTLCVRINPQVTGDPDPSDDICISVCTGMSGTYTIDGSSPTAGTNYQTFTDAAAALSNCGIGGPVLFNVAPGTYNEDFTISQVLGSSATNTITFDGQHRDSVTITKNLTSANTAIVKLDGTDYTTFKRLTVDIPGTYGFGFHLTNQADNDSIFDVAINMPLTSTSTYHIGVLCAGATYSTYDNAANNLVVKDCDIEGGYYGFRIHGVNTSTFTNNNQILDCNISEFYYCGIYSYYQNNPHYNGNDVRGRTGGGSTSGFGIRSYYSDGSFEFTHNRIYNVGYMGLYVYYGNQSRNGRGLVANNQMGGYYTTTGSAYPLYMYNNRSTDVYHNSTNLCSSGGYGAYISGTSAYTDSLDIRNNIFKGSSSYALYCASASYVTDIDHNVYYSTSSTPFYFGTAFPSLATWQSSYPAFNTGSIMDVPGYVACNDLDLFCSPADDMGEPVGILDDVLGNTRSTTTPDPGAIEFTSQSVSINLGNDTTHCGTYVLVGDTTNFNIFQWSTGTGAYAINVDSTDTISVYAIDSNNCRASDTIMITILDRPDLPFNNDTIQICNTTPLDAQNPGSTYLWNTTDTTQVIYTPNPGIYTVDITSVDGCLVTDTVTVDWFPVSSVNLGPDQQFCLGGSATLNAGTQPTGSSFSWSTGATTQVSVVTAPGTYYVQVTTPDGCIGSDTILVDALLPPVVNLGADTTVCNPLTLDAANPGATYAWNTGPTSQSITVTTSGAYTVTVTNAAGCSITDNINITVATAPSVNLGNNPILCDGQSVTLNAGNTGSNYLWSNGSTNQSISVNSAGTYIVVVTDPNTGCTGSDSITVNQSFLSVNLGNDVALCNGSIMLDAGSGATGYLWSTGATSQTVNVNTAGTYSVVVSDAAGCNASDTIQVLPATAITAAFSSPSSIPLWQTVSFTDNSTGGAVSWLWDFGDGTTSTAQNPTHNFVAMGNFQVCLTVSDGTCDNTICQTINVQAPIGIDDELFAQGVKVYPNPNNGRFNIGFELDEFENVNIEVFNIAGQLVYGQQLNAVLNHNETVEMNDTPAGIYILRLTTESGKQIHRKLVIE